MSAKPLRKVLSAIPLSTHTAGWGGRSTRRWWSLRLECGHEVERPRSFAKTPPARVRCGECHLAPAPAPEPTEDGP